MGKIMLGQLALGAAMLGAVATMATPKAAALTPELGEMIVFVQPNQPLGARFAELHQPALVKLADELGLALSIVDVIHGAPAEVGITPLIVYQNFRGRSIFQGRFTDIGRIRNFVRTSRYAPQQDVDFTRENTALWRTGRAQIAAPVKVTALAGTPPPDYDEADFQRRARSSIDAGFTLLDPLRRISLSRSDRLFYMDYYTWAADDGILHLSLALYSQFHCKQPIFETAGEPLIGSWNHRDELFRRGGERLEAELMVQLGRDTLGDGFDPVPDATPTKSWADIGFPLPQAPAAEATDFTGMKLSQAWRLTATSDASPPAIQFRFPAPIDHYRGLIGHSTGELTLGPGLSFEGSSGWVEADVTSITMGAADLDENIQGKTYLRTSQYPRARFQLHSLRSDEATLAFGHISQVTVVGTFRMRGAELPLTFTAQLEPIIIENRELRLLFDGVFEINLRRPFGMLTADGPFPQNETVIIDLALQFAPARASDTKP